MRIAIIDCGTNTFNLLVAEATPEGWSTVFQNKLPVKLGAGGFQQQEIAASRFNRGLDAMLAFRATIDNYGVQKVYAFATSAIRESRNGRDFVKRVEEVAAIPIEVIDGQSEADLIYQGVKASVDLGNETSLIMDIGGGSTEFIIGDASGIRWKKSYLLGVSRIHELIRPSERPDHEAVFALRQLLDRELSDLRTALSQHPCRWLVGSSGSFDTLLDLFRHAATDVDRSIPPGLTNDIPMSAFPAIHAWLMGSTFEQRLRHPAIPAIRAEYMPLASFLVKYVLELHPFRRLVHSAWSLKEGAMQQFWASHDWKQGDEMKDEQPGDFLED